MVRKSIKKSKNKHQIIRVRVKKTDIVKSVKTRLNEERKTLTFYRDHDCGAYDAMERGEFFDYWKWHINDEFNDALKEVDNEGKWERNKHYGDYGNILISERPVYLIKPNAKVIQESDLHWTKWVIPLKLKGEKNESSDSEISENS